MSCRMFSRIPRLYPLEVSSNPPTPVMTTKISQKVPNVPWRAKITPLRTTLLYRRLHGFPYNIFHLEKMRRLNVSDYFLVRFSDTLRWHRRENIWYILKSL